MTATPTTVMAAIATRRLGCQRECGAEAFVSSGVELFCSENVLMRGMGAVEIDSRRESTSVLNLNGHVVMLAQLA